MSHEIKIDQDAALITQAKFCPSPHYDERPRVAKVDLLVIHSISLPPGKFGGEDIEAFFTGKLDVNRDPYFQSISHLRVASHLLIKRDGSIVQFVAFDKRAWHAGESMFDGRSNCNDFSIGIELEGTDDLSYMEVQYDRLTAVVKALQEVYSGITPERIVGHAEIAPGRKTDPGPMFDWAYFKGRLI